VPRLDLPIGPAGPIIEVRLRVGPEQADTRAAGRPVPPPISVLGLVDTGAEVSAIQRSLADWMGVPVSHFLETRSSVLGDESRIAAVYRIARFGHVFLLENYADNCSREARSVCHVRGDLFDVCFLP
jgi:hypothetical protein